MSLRATASSGPNVLAGVNFDGTPVSWLEANWPFFTWAIFLFGSGVLAANFKNRDSYWYGWLAMVSYCLHQSEEHAYDIRGWRYAFVPSLNLGPISKIYAAICAETEEPLGCPLDPKITLYVNVLMIWIGFGGCMVAATFNPSRFLFSGSLNWGVSVFNGVFGHMMPAVLSQSYNPGFVQSIFMVPLGIYLIRESGRPFLCIFNGILVHAVMALAVVVIVRFDTNEAVTMTVALLAVCPVLTLVISNYVATHSPTTAKKDNKKQ